MFTKCPECSISFRVTAKVLQQANGNVRCGGCGHAFSALAYLSEEMPTADHETNETAERDELAETSRRLLETLDELAGPEEVRIEDTGIEWRVLDDNESGDADKTANVTEEMRYDDSTLLPDDFGKDEDVSFTPPDPKRREADRLEEKTAEFDAAQKDLQLSEPGDWTDLLEEVRDPEPEAESLEVEEELAAIHSQLSAREEPDSRDAKPADLDAQFGTQAEAMGLDIISSEDALTDQFPLLYEDDIESGEPAEEADETPGDDQEDDLEEDDEVTLVDDNVHDDAASDGPDDDERDLDGEEIEDDDVEDEEEGEEIEGDNVEDEEEGEEIEDDDVEDEEEGEDEIQIAGLESTGEFESKIDVAARALSGDDEEAVSSDEAPAEDSADVDTTPDEQSPEYDDSGEIKHIVPQPTEEEMTVNMEIDQEMMALATQDDEFSATLFGVENPEELFNENPEAVETIVMEGEFVRGSIEKERLASEHAAKSQLDDPGSLVDTYALRRGKVRGGRRRHDPTAYGLTGAVIILALALAGQWIHNSRDSLATMGFFNQTIAPVYRMLGNPVTPSWDIKGWQFEVTNGSVDEAESALTIVSRIVNRAALPLPYPLVHVSLTDRWEEIMGSRILEPGEYLAGDLDPSSPVLPGENFTAVITIEEPSAEATGFKLNVCYRVSAGTVRCAIEDFKN